MSNVRGYPQVVSKITVLSASGLQKQDHFGGGEIPAQCATSLIDVP